MLKIRNILKKILPFRIKQFIRGFKSGYYSYFLWLFPLKDNKIVICNYYGKGYGDNGKYIAEEIIRQNLGYDIVWLLKKELVGNVEFPAEIRTVKYNSLMGLYELATAKVWIDNCRKYFYPPKRKKQFYIQTWHAGIGLKRVEKDVENILDERYIHIAKKDSVMADLFLSNSDYISKLYKSSFWYEGEILKSGLPRNDVMFNNDYYNFKGKVEKFFKIKEDVKIALYAPTFRKNNSVQVYNLDYSRCISELSKRFGGDWIILIRLHPNISEKSSEIEYGDKIYNASYYDDMQELLACSDVLITDYSSSMFDFGLKKKPCFLYVPDLDEYIKDRNFYLNIDELPFPMSGDNNEFIKKIRNFDKKSYLIGMEKFYNMKGDMEDGSASKRVVEKIKKVLIEYN